MKRSERTALISKIVSDAPGKVFGLSYFCDIFAVCRSYISQAKAPFSSCGPTPSRDRTRTCCSARTTLMTLQRMPGKSRRLSGPSALCLSRRPIASSYRTSGRAGPRKMRYAACFLKASQRRASSALTTHALAPYRSLRTYIYVKAES